MQPVLSRLTRLPDKAFIEYLRMAGVQLLPWVRDFKGPKPPRRFVELP